MVMENENEKSSFQWSLNLFCNSVVICTVFHCEYLA